MIGFYALGTLPLGASEIETSRAVFGEAGAFVITGNDVGLYATRLLTTDTGTFSITGVDALFERTANRLRVSSGGGVRGLRASSGGGGKGLRIRA